MKFYLIAGEASGDLHASHLMQSLKNLDADAQFRFFGGDLMSAAGGTCVRHYRDLAYMGFIPVLLHLPVILRNMRMCKADILSWQPDCVILVDYPGFNLKIAKFVKSRTNIPVYVDELFSILPFEVDFFEGKHHYPIHYVGNPTAAEVKSYLEESGKRKEEREYSAADNAAVNNQENNQGTNHISFHSPLSSFHSNPSFQSKVIALLAGSRQQEIKDNLPAMLEAVKPYENDYQIILAGAPGIEAGYYQQFIEGRKVQVVYNQTYDLLSKAHAALVTSGTATLETALFRVPQVVCYETPLPTIIGWLRKRVLKVKYISLVNLIVDAEVVKELVADSFSVKNIRQELTKILDGPARQQMLDGYTEVNRRLGDQVAPDNAARLIMEKLSQK